MRHLAQRKPKKTSMAKRKADANIVRVATSRITQEIDQAIVGLEDADFFAVMEFIETHCLMRQALRNHTAEALEWDAKTQGADFSRVASSAKSS